MSLVVCLRSNSYCGLVCCRGFICAQVAVYDEVVAYNADLPLLKREKKIRQQGKKYFVNEGDIISFDFYTPQQLDDMQKNLDAGNRR